MNIYDKATSKWIGEIKSELDRLAHDNMVLPKSDPFEHGISVGTYQGLRAALQIYEDLLKEVDI